MTGRNGRNDCGAVVAGAPYYGSRRVPWLTPTDFQKAKRPRNGVIRYGNLPPADRQFGADRVTETEGKSLTT